jgi:EAL domain-containing protein (putative c-di-GMP-specific phosphodiesterase class I)
VTEDELPNAHNCHCQTTQRSVALLMSGLESGFMDFRSVVSRFEGIYHSDMSVVEFPIGERGFASVAALRDFVLTQWGSEAGELRCCWLDQSKPVAQQLTTLVAARPLSDWVENGETPLRQILDSRSIETWFQPLFKGRELQLWGYECLARARDEAGQLVPPADLFNWARKENLIFMLDRVCRERHIENCALVPDRAKYHFLINFLPSVIYEPSVCLRSTFATARRVSLDPSQVVFEVVETDKVPDREHLRTILDEYRDAGFRVALDDVGTGHSGLTLLADLSPDLIKIDQELVSRCVDSDIHAAICQSIIEIGRVAGKLVVAEGIETRQQFDLMLGMGADLFQGYLLGKPSASPATQSLISPPGPIPLTKQPAA